MKNRYPNTAHCPHLPVLYICILTFLTSLLLIISEPANSAPHSKRMNDSFDKIYKQVFPKELYKDERKKYKKAMKYLRQGNITKYEPLAKELVDYPLYTFLHYQKLKRSLATSKTSEFADFFAENADSPTAGWLRNAWLKSLAERKEWKTYVEFYIPSKNKTQACTYYWALHEIGNESKKLEAAKKKAFRGAKKLWMVGESQPDDCSPLFKAWQKSPSFKQSYIWDRIGLAIRKGNVSLTKFLAKSIPEDDQKLVDLWLKVRANVNTLKKKSRFKDTPKNRQIILYGLGRMAYNNLDGALLLWNQYMREFSFTQEELAKTQEYIARLLAFSFHTEAGLWLEQANQEMLDHDLTEKQIRIELRKQDWNAVLKWITLLPEEMQDKSIWQYWRARALQEQAATRGAALIRQQHFPSGLASRIPSYKNVMATHLNFTYNFNANLPVEHLLPQLLDESFIQKSNEAAKAIFEEIASERSFYGFLSSQYISQPMSLNLDRIVVSLRDLKNLAQYRGVMRASELVLVDRELDAKREWIHLIKGLTPNERTVAAKVAEFWGWPFYAIYTASRSDNIDDIDLRFPRIFHSSVSKNAQKNDIATEWVFSVIRQESAFRKDAKSPVGALGVMQLMPATAKYVSEKIGLKYQGNQQLLNPETNIKLGSSYLKYLLDRFDGNMIMATAAYNAGPHRSDQWRPKTKPIKGDIWVETIPIKETRQYVKNIVAYQAIYQYQLGFNPQLTKSLQEISPKKR